MNWLVELILLTAAVIAALGVIWKARVVHWLFERNVVEPIRTVVQSAVMPIIRELDEKNTAQHADSQRMHREWRDTVTARFDSIEGKVDGIDGRTTSIEAYLTTPTSRKEAS